MSDHGRFRSAEAESEVPPKDYPTDVLSFPAEQDGFIGDVAVSLTRARAQAKQWGHSVEDEVSILLLHGVLHLTGMDHESDNGDMAHVELQWRKKFGLPASLIERVTS